MNEPNDASHPNHAIPDAETAKVKIAPPTNGNVDLSKDREIQSELAAATPPAMDATVKDSLEKLREGTKEGLSPKDHYDLGVAYLGMGLVDDAVREFNEAGSSEQTVAEAVKATKKPAQKPAAMKAPPKKAPGKAQPAKKAPAKKKPAQKAAAKRAKKPVARKAAKKAPARKSARKAAPKKAAKKPARKTAAKKPARAAKKKPARKARR